jgi:hypothetical protein
MSLKKQTKMNKNYEQGDKKGHPGDKKVPAGGNLGTPWRGSAIRFFGKFKDKFEFIIAENRFTWYIHQKNPTQKVGRLRRRAAVFLWKSSGEF